MEKEKNTNNETKKKIPVWLIVVLGIVTLIAIVLVSLYSCGKKALEAFQPTYVEEVAEKRTIVSTIEKSGALESANSYSVTTLVSGDVLSADFEEGDIVEKDSVLYLIDSGDASSNVTSANNNLSSAKLNLESARRNYADQEEKYNESVADVEKRTLVAPFGGTVTDLSIEVDDEVQKGTFVANLTDTDNLKLTQYFSYEYRDYIKVGDTVSVSVGDKMLNLVGNVSEISYGSYVTDTGMNCFTVVVDITNPGTLTSNDFAVASKGEAYSTGAGKLEYKNEKRITFETSGDVSKVLVKNYSKVNKGDIIAVVTDDDVKDDMLLNAYIQLKNAENQVTSAENQVKNANDNLDRFEITAPIDGTIVSKNIKEGETVDEGALLCIIYDLSYLTVDLSIDELDISKVKVGQEATVTADAVEGKEYRGVVTRVGVNGTYQGGVTTYPVTVRIDDTEGLLPGMNVDASIVIEKADNVITIPAAAVERGNRVLVKSTDGTTSEGAPEGYEYRDISIGLSDGDYVEVTEGISEGETVTFENHIVGTTSLTDMMYGMGGMRSDAEPPQGTGGGMSGRTGGGMPSMGQ